MAKFELKSHLSEISALCDQHKVRHLYAFGSVLTGNFSAESDIDLIVDFKPIALEQFSDNYYDLKFSLEEILKKPIDLLEEQAIKNPFFKEAVLQSRQQIF
jgi:predicted nucleotidyltransferase